MPGKSPTPSGGNGGSFNLAQHPDFTKLKHDLDQLRGKVGSLHAVLGLRMEFGQTPPGALPAPPRILKFIVHGIDGKYVIDIVPSADATTANAASVLASTGAVQTVVQMQRAMGPAQRVRATVQPGRGQQQGVFYQLQSCITANWDVAGSLNTYGPEAKTHWVIDDSPNQTRFWRVRAKFQNSDYGEWVYFEDPVVCGILPVWSQVVRNASTAAVNQAYSRNGGSPLTQHGVTTQIDVAAAIWKSGDGFTGAPRSVSYNSGFVDPGVLGTYFVYAHDPKLAGGTVTFIATANVEDLNSFDDVMYFGKITTAGGGGGTGSGGGAGPCVIGDVLIEMADGSFLPAKMLLRGDKVRNIVGGVDTLVSDPEIAGNVPCFEFTMDNGIVLKGCSSRHSLKYYYGGFEFAFELHEGDTLLTKQGPAKIARKRFLGHMTVYKYHLDNDKTYWTDGVGSHNINASLK